MEKSSKSKGNSHGAVTINSWPKDDIRRFWPVILFKENGRLQQHLSLDGTSYFSKLGYECDIGLYRHFVYVLRGKIQTEMTWKEILRAAMALGILDKLLNKTSLGFAHQFTETFRLTQAILKTSLSLNLAAGRLLNRSCFFSKDTASPGLLHFKVMMMTRHRFFFDMISFRTVLAFLEDMKWSQEAAKTLLWRFPNTYGCQQHICENYVELYPFDFPFPEDVGRKILRMVGRAPKTNLVVRALRLQQNASYVSFSGLLIKFN